VKQTNKQTNKQGEQTYSNSTASFIKGNFLEDDYREIRVLMDVLPSQTF